MKPLLVGEANPYQSDPRLAQRYALYPEPERCAGWNLCYKVMQLEEDEYLRRFDRVNLCDGKWATKEARVRANAIRDENIGTNRIVVLFGAKVTRAFMYPFIPFDTIVGTYVCLPHPSGLSRAWNEPGDFERARAVLREAGVL